jgi:hypothetical protein
MPLRSQVGKSPRGPTPPIKSAASSRSSSRQSVLSLGSSASSLKAPPYSPYDKRDSSAVPSARSTPRIPTPKGRHVISKYDPLSPPFRPIREREEGSLSAVTSRTSSHEKESVLSRVSSFSDSGIASRITSASSELCLDPSVPCSAPTGPMPLTRRRSASAPESGADSQVISRIGSGDSTVLSANAAAVAHVAAQLALAASALSRK